MKIFLDTAHLPTIEQWAGSGIIDGVTTNPTHLSRQDDLPKEVITQICQLLPHGDISVEITQKDPDAAYTQALAISAIAPNITVKIPCHVNYYPIIKKLVEQGVRVNVTLVFSLTQGLCVSKLGATYISPFVGRLQDSGGNGIELVASLRQMLDFYGYHTQLLAASLRTVEHLQEVILCGADVATIPASLLAQATTHPLTDKGIALFDADWQKRAIKQFP